MKNKQRGFGAVQAVMGIVIVMAIGTVAVPKYQDYVVRSKMSEAFSVIADTKTKLAEFYTMKNRFPETERELAAIETEMFSRPEFVEKVVLKGQSADHDVIIQVYFRPDVIPGETFNDEYMYVAGHSGSERGGMVEWSCGLEGIDEKFLPTRCSN